MMGFSIQFPVNLNPDIHDDSFYLLESSFSFSLDSIVVSLFVIRKRKLRRNGIVLEDDVFFSRDKMSDIYVKG